MQSAVSCLRESVRNSTNTLILALQAYKWLIFLILVRRHVANAVHTKEAQGPGHMAVAKFKEQTRPFKPVMKQTAKKLFKFGIALKLSLWNGLLQLLGVFFYTCIMGIRMPEIMFCSSS